MHTAGSERQDVADEPSVMLLSQQLVKYTYRNSEVCHPSCVFKLYGEINSVKNTTINIWLNDGVY